MDDYKKPFESNVEAAGSGVSSAAARIKDQISGTVANAKEKVVDAGRKAADKIDESRGSAAEALSGTASSLHSGGDQLSGAVHSAADKIQDTAGYLRRTNLKAMGDDALGLVRNYPGQCLTAAVVLGFVAAFALRGRD
jgi:hypothetical protein